MNLPNSVSQYIREFLYTDGKCIYLNKNEILPLVLSIRNLPETCQRLVEAAASDKINNFDCCTYSAVSVAKAYLQTIGKYDKLMRWQFEYIHNKFTGAISFSYNEDGSFNIITLVRAINYLTDTTSWMTDYLSSPTAIFASSPDEHNDGFHVRIIGEEYLSLWSDGEYSETDL
jgi:hypothetical protein